MNSYHYVIIGDDFKIKGNGVVAATSLVEAYTKACSVEMYDPATERIFIRPNN